MKLYQSSSVSILIAVSSIFFPSTIRADCLDETTATVALQPAPLAVQKMNYKVAGSHHNETVVLIHGLGSRLQTWDKVADALAKKYRVVVYDVRGHGKTEAAGEVYRSDVLANDLKHLLDHF